jgi:tetratricopeptide (TPR) repeat protein
MSLRQQLVQLDFLHPRFLPDGDKRYAPLTFTAQYLRDSTVTRFFRSAFDEVTFGIVQRVDEDGNPSEEFGNETGDPTLNRLTLALETNRTISRRDRSIVFFRYRFEDVRLYNIESLLIKELLLPDARIRISGFGVTLVRDHGNELERDGKQKEAMAMYEQSYKAYRRAHQLDPTNVRLRNDCALIDIYHLEREWDFSKQLLDSAIADGDKTLRDNPPADANDKQQLEEAVGDCFENLALWHLKHSKDGAAAKAAAQQSQKYHPGAGRPGARRHLQAAERLLQGK